MCRHMCQHLDVSTYMSASKWVGIFVNIRKMCWYMSAYFWPLVVDCVGISMCWYMCRHMNVSTCVWASEYVSIFVSRKSNTRKKCVDIYVGIFRTTNRMYWRLDLSTFVSTYKCQLGCDVDLELDGRIAVIFCKRSSLKRKCLHFDEIFITGCTESCQNDNFQCSQWWKFHQNDDIFVSVMERALCFAL